MEKRTLVIKCCICGRQKTESGWQFGGELLDEEVEYSHGLCASCYETEMMKIQLGAIAESEALSA